MLKHFNPVHITLGWGVRKELGLVLSRSTFIVSGARTIERGKLKHLVTEGCRRSTPVYPNPSDKVIDCLLAEMGQQKIDTVLGIGGGSVMDAAKIVALLYGNVECMEEYRMANRLLERKVRLIQVPTTAGTGSEVTRWASLWNDGVKSSLDEAGGFADFAYVDAELCLGAPARLALGCGLDAMSHAMESLWGIHCNPISRGYAVSALRLLSKHLPIVCCGRGERDSWEAMALASTLAGLALSCTRSAAAHALSYQLTGRFGLEHGLAVGLLCRSLLRYNQQAAPEALEAIVGSLGVKSIDEAQAFIDRCFELSGLAPRLSAFDIDSTRFSEVVEEATSSNRLGNNPGNLERDTLTKVLEDIA